MMSSCDRIRHELAAYSEGLLEPPEAAKVAQHLSTCPTCRAEADRHEAVWELLGADAPVEAAADLARRVVAQVRVEEREAPGRVAPFPTWRRWLVPALASAAAVLLVLGALLLQRASREPSGLASLSEEERQVVANLDLLEEYDLLEHLDLLENLELLEHQEVVRRL